MSMHKDDKKDVLITGLDDIDSLSGLLDDDDGEDILSSVDAAIDSILLADEHEHDSEFLVVDQFSQELEDASRGEVQTVFERILLQYLEPLKTFINSILRGDLSETVVEGFRGTLEPLVEATGKLSLSVQHEIFVGFGNLLSHIESLPAPVPYRVIRPFADNYIVLVESISQEIRDEYFSDVRYKRNSNGLLEEFRKIKFIGTQRLQRLYAAGLTTIEAVEGASTIDIAVTTGISFELAEKLKQTAEEYRDRLERERIDRVTYLTRDLMESLRGLRHERSVRVLSEVRPILLNLDEELRSELEYLQNLFGQRLSRHQQRH